MIRDLRLAFWALGAATFVGIPMLTILWVDLFHRTGPAAEMPGGVWPQHVYNILLWLDLVGLVVFVCQTRRYVPLVFVLAIAFFLFFTAVWFWGGIAMNGVYP